MTRINPEVLRTERAKKNWSIDDLAKRSHVDRQSIHRIEKGDKKRNRTGVIKNLAKALDISEEFLTGAFAASAPEKEVDAPDETPFGSQLNLRVSNGPRNALVLVARRYGVSLAQIVEIAPLLFFWAAEKSLQKRRDRLSELDQKYEEISQLGKAFSYLHGRAFHNWNAEETLAAEASSIEARDVFGKTIGDTGFESALPDQYEESEDNPFTMFLRELVSEFSEAAEIVHWFPDSSPHYSVCKKEVLGLVGGDEEAADYIHSGQAPLHKLPKELREKGKEQQRAEWSRALGKQWLADLGI